MKDLLDIYNNNYIIMTDKEMNTFCRLFMITNHISENDEESVLNNIVLLENMMKKALMDLLTVGVKQSQKVNLQMRTGLKPEIIFLRLKMID